MKEPEYSKMLIRKSAFMDKHNSVEVNFDQDKLIVNSQFKEKENNVEYINLLEIVKLIDRILYNTFEEPSLALDDTKSVGFKRSKGGKSVIKRQNNLITKKEYSMKLFSEHDWNILYQYFEKNFSSFHGTMDCF